MNTSTQLPTIAAIATPIGQGGVGVIRLSGKAAYEIGCAITRRDHLTPRMAHFGGFYGIDGIIDEGVVIYFKAPHSFTGEDVVELQGHGGMVLQNMLLARVFELGARQATAGEFSYRAFENDKMDLVQAEAISDAIAATSTAQASSAIRSLTGEFSHKINHLVDELTHLRLYVEAAIDFPDEEDVDFLGDGVIESKINSVLGGIDAILDTAKQGQLLRDGVHVVLAGKPNAGKSSLLNRLSGTERAIVTDIAGTTRDTLEETLVLGGLTVHLTDTAGLRDTVDKVEQIGIARAFDAIKKADVLLMVYDVNTEHDPLALAHELFAAELDTEMGEIIRQKLIMVANKCDLLDALPEAGVSHETNDTPKIVHVSCETSYGIDTLVQVLSDKVGFHPPENSLIARTRHIDALKRAKAFTLEALEQLTVYHAGELVADSLRLSQQALGEITGQMSADELLGKIFSSFCIGK
ncbi:tRNA uridine-5-carboxymethylaminomethyl(34) synthesis GTPase MnmE [Moraxella sp. FZLJ2107]|uniref:tRNA uridine-5-carboxymethylaminomethyl(34) synthesis GTPase MnmE n=1 Tax=unclassified Moraxella TaxID=2685852 RepID=UPI0020C938BC|nr:MULTISPECIES: tRNA uridine-5-carboxymethylaminomethyl(34) synthesis GTPase MnmE [unclassified Moraxella]UTO04395.1 tRNA uridine-5-carboxymethylaminomethyl(34) synthesis GTPase MnmE [Moraxella sp. FZLJ2107]UTO23228.1 tRNA uridine-5-carboxymethylaminomethyl(34) synthesis GTPase MnmE [Moraxella sp. FZLJ2109]